MIYNVLKSLYIIGCLSGMLLLNILSMMISSNEGSSSIYIFFCLAIIQFIGIALETIDLYNKFKSQGETHGSS